MSAGKDGRASAGEAGQLPASFLQFLQQSCSEAVVDQSAPPSGAPVSGAPVKDPKQKKSGSDSPVLDSQMLTVPADNLQQAPPFTPEPGVESEGRPDGSRANLPAIALPKALSAPASAPQRDFHVEWNKAVGTGSQAELAFALRLTPLSPAAIARTPNARPDAALEGVVGKAGAVLDGLRGSPAAKQSESTPGTGAEYGKNEESSRGSHAANHGPTSTDQPVKAARTEKAEAPAAVEDANVRQSGMETRPVSPLVHSVTSSSLPEGPSSPKAAEQPAPARAPAPIDQEDKLTASPTLKEISMQLSSDGDRKVDVRLVQRAGEVLVSVRTQDVALAHEMRQELGSLTGKLAQGGYATEQFAPPSAGASNLSDQRNNPENRDSSHGRGQDPQHGGSSQQQQPQDGRGERPAWFEEMENSLTQRQTNRSKAWLPLQ